MNFFSSARFRVLFLSAALPLAVYANCGLDYCPRNPGADGGVNQLSLSVRNYAFDLPGGSGSSGNYQEALLHYAYNGLASFALGASLPLERLSAGSETRVGLSNPLLSATYYRRVAMMQMLYLGLQLELPLGDGEHGLAAHHYMLVPYAQWEGAFAWGGALVGAGVSNALGGHEADSADAPLFVHPHEDRELLYKIAYSPRLPTDRVKPRVFVSGEYALVDEPENGPGKSHVTAGVSAEWIVAPRWSVEPVLEFPLETPARFDWSFGAAVKTGW